jgi:hypothetical protein
VRRLMAKRPEDRYQTPAELVTDLTGKVGRAAASMPVGDAETLADGGRLPTGVRSSSKSGRKWPWIAAGAGGMLLAMCGLCLFGALLAPKDSGKNTQSVTATGVSKTTGPVRATRPAGRYVKMATREETLLATLKANGLPNFEGRWHAIGYFDLDPKQGADAVYPPEKEIDLNKTYPGKQQKTIGWKDFKFQAGRTVSLNKLMPDAFLAHLGAVAYLYHEIEAAEPVDLPIAVGGADSLIIFLNGERVFHHLGLGPFDADQNSVNFKLKSGKNKLLVKSCNGFAQNAVYLCPQWPAKLESQFGQELKRDFPK